MEFLRNFLFSASAKLLKNLIKKVQKSQAVQYTGLTESFPRHAKIGSDEARHGKAFEGLLNRYFK